jgi:mRNA-degrading endonuclease toxin of MazEF toxin-antitoxin module
MRRGDVRWYVFEPPDKRRPVLILTRNSAIGVLNTVTVDFALGFDEGQRVRARWRLHVRQIRD